MNSRRSLSAAGIALLTSLLSPGCFAVANLDRFEVEPPACTGNATEERDYNWRVIGLVVPHLNQRFEMKVIETTTGEVAAAIVYDGVPDDTRASVAGTLRNALLPGTYRTQFWADRSMSGAFEFGSEDHAWIEAVPDTGCFEFEHDAPFDADVAPTDDDLKGNVTVRLLGLPGALVGSPLIYRVRVERAAGLREVGYYRLDAIPMDATAAPDMTLYDIAEADSVYVVNAIVDRDLDGKESEGDDTFESTATLADPDVFIAIDLGAL